MRRAFNWHAEFQITRYAKSQSFMLFSAGVSILPESDRRALFICGMNMISPSQNGFNQNSAHARAGGG
ncbi:hypothetical protein AFK63_03085 [Cronobacter muytjensii ATCC 51329]|nr:hypothetical protein AFK63_03085 [Cronobacter muytjensii ATCC 51329]